MKLTHYIDGSDLTVVTDHHALQWILNIKATTNSRLHKWAMLLLPSKGGVPDLAVDGSTSLQLSIPVSHIKILCYSSVF